MNFYSISFGFKHFLEIILVKKNNNWRITINILKFAPPRGKPATKEPPEETTPVKDSLYRLAESWLEAS